MDFSKGYQAMPGTDAAEHQSLLGNTPVPQSVMASGMATGTPVMQPTAMSSGVTPVLLRQQPWQGGGLYACNMHWPTCCFAYFASPCLFAETAEEILEERDAFCKYMLLYSLVPLGLTVLSLAMCAPAGQLPANLAFCLSTAAARSYIGGGVRRRIREKYNLAESPCNDYLVYAFCSCCAVAEEARELRLRTRRVATM